jgi:hypothetical protein
MKFKFIFLVITFSSVAARADFVMEEHAVFWTNLNSEIITKIHGDKIRIDKFANLPGSVYGISDVKTGDELTLMPDKKIVMKSSAADVKEMAEKMKKRSGNTNAVPIKPVDTGKSEKVDGYDTEIYTWSRNDLIETMWVAKDFPDYEKIKIELAKMEQSSAFLSRKDKEPDVSVLPGMVVKKYIVGSNGRTATITLVSAKIEPVDPSVFEVPSGYTDWKSPALPNQQTSAITTNK